MKRVSSCGWLTFGKGTGSSESRYGGERLDRGMRDSCYYYFLRKLLSLRIGGNGSGILVPSQDRLKTFSPGWYGCWTNIVVSLSIKIWSG
jgi:hypothetical protein